jgi:hypothetical protein
MMKYVELSISPDVSPLPGAAGLQTAYCTVEDYVALLKHLRKQKLSMRFGRYDVERHSVYISHEDMKFGDFKRIFKRTGHVDKVDKWETVMYTANCCLLWFSK